MTDANWHPWGIGIATAIFILFLVVAIKRFADAVRKRDFRGGNRWH